MGSKIITPGFNPFPGLRPFAPDEHDLFFGREVESGEVLDKLLKNRFVTVVGASGSGKSSLIYCGVLNRLKKLDVYKSSQWKIISFRPGNNPYGNLGGAILENIDPGLLPEVTCETIISDLQERSAGITTVLKKYLTIGNEKLLLVVDQFEELFRYSTLSAGSRSKIVTGQFVGDLVKSVQQSELDMHIIISMRSDFIGECAHYQGLTQLINSSNYLVPHMDKESYRQVIEGPVLYAGAGIEQRLVERILNEIGDKTDQLPVLQHVMMRTWIYWRELDEPSRQISTSDYEAVGTMSDAMSRHADEAYEELDLRGKEICEKLFRAITEKGTDNKGIRCPTSVNTLKLVIECTDEELFNVVDKFRTHERSFITPHENIMLGNDSVIDLSHESIMRLWDHLRQWVDDEAASVQMYMRLSEASAMYQKGKTSLWRPPDLQLAINWRDQNKPTLAWAQRYDPAFERAMVYLRTSEKEYLEEEERKILLQKRQIRRTKIIAMILGGAAIISVGFMLFAFVQKIAADRQTILAETRRQVAEKERVRADSSTVVAIQKQQLADSNAVIAKQNEAEAFRQQRFAQIQQTIAERNAEEALRQEQIALIQSDSAKRASIRADQNATVATEQRNNAMRLRMLSIGKSMAVKSLQVQGQQDLQTLLAYQAYIFNKRNNGPDNDADIYTGLYNVARQYGSSAVKTFRGHTGEIKSIAFVPGRNEFFTSGYDGQVLKWTIDGEKESFQVVYSGSDIIEVLTVSPDESWLACGSGNSSIRMIPLKGNSVQYELAGHTGKIKSLVFSFDSKFLYSASLDGKVIKWDINSRTGVDVTTGSMQITSIDISSDGKYVAGINTSGNVVLWNPEKQAENFRIETTGKNIKVIRFKPDENLLAIGDVNGNVELWDIENRKRISEVKAHSAQVNDIQFNTVLKQMATASNDKTLKIFNVKDITDLTEPPVTLTDNEGFVMVINFSPDGKMIVSGTYEGTENLVGRPTHSDNMVKDICTLVSRNLTQDEWNVYVAKDIPIEAACQEKSYNIKVNVLK